MWPAVPPRPSNSGIQPLRGVLSGRFRGLGVGSRPVVGAACALVLAAGAATVPTTLAPAAAAAGEGPVLIGDVGGRADVDSVELYAMPTDEVLRALPVGEQADLVALESAQAAVDGTKFSVFLDPAEVPDQVVDDLGVVQLHVVASTARGTYLSNASLRAAAPTQAAGGQARAGESQDLVWVDPLSYTPRPQSATRTHSSDSSARAEAGGEGFVVSLSKFTRVPASQALNVSRSEPGEPEPPSPACWWDKLKTKVRWATLGTTYPIKGDNALMVVSSSTGARYGVAGSAKDVSGNWGEFKAGEEKFTQDGWGKTWPGSSKTRSYRKGIEYGLFRLSCTRGCTKCAKKWFPIGETGGTGSNEGIPRPDWTKCARNDPGPWWRDSSEGTAYSYGAAVKFAGVIGIDLSITRQYNGSQKLLYKLRSDRRMCGNNGEWPSTAGKVMSRPLK